MTLFERVAHGYTGTVTVQILWSLSGYISRFFLSFTLGTEAAIDCLPDDGGSDAITQVRYFDPRGPAKQAVGSWVSRCGSPPLWNGSHHGTRKKRQLGSLLGLRAFQLSAWVRDTEKEVYFRG